jgi:hypothetical protein
MLPDYTPVTEEVKRPEDWGQIGGVHGFDRKAVIWLRRRAIGFVKTLNFSEDALAAYKKGPGLYRFRNLPISQARIIVRAYKPQKRPSSSRGNLSPARLEYTAWSIK